MRGLFVGAVAGLIIALTVIVAVLGGGIAALLIHQPCQATSTSFMPTTVVRSNQTLKAVTALSAKLDAQRSEYNSRFSKIDERLERLEPEADVTPPVQESPCDGWSEPTIPRHE